jgi:class 3 adenylate cyclase
MASFSSVSEAIRCSLAIQEALRLRNEDNDAQVVYVAIGLAAGEPIAEDDDLFGTAVNLAARVCDVAQAGEVLVTNVVKELSIGKNFEFEHVGEVELKGFPDPVPIARVLA